MIRSHAPSASARRSISKAPGAPLKNHKGPDARLQEESLSCYRTLSRQGSRSGICDESESELLGAASGSVSDDGEPTIRSLNGSRSSSAESGSFADGSRPDQVKRMTRESLLSELPKAFPNRPAKLEKQAARTHLPRRAEVGKAKDAPIGVAKPGSQIAAPGGKSLIEQYRSIPHGFKRAMGSFVTFSPETQSLIDDVKAGLKSFDDAEKQHDKAVKAGDQKLAQFYSGLMKLQIAQAFDDFASLKGVLQGALYDSSRSRVDGHQRDKQVTRMQNLLLQMRDIKDQLA